jgi:apolipoprotein N-acyltransferase
LCSRECRAFEPVPQTDPPASSSLRMATVSVPCSFARESPRVALRAKFTVSVRPNLRLEVNPTKLPSVVRTPEERSMIALLCALLSGALFYLSTGIGNVWPLAWLAPVPLLWLAYGRGPTWQVVVASSVAFTLGLLNVVQAYGSIILTIAPFLPVVPMLFAAAVLFARFAHRQTPAVIAVFAFPTLWTGIEYLMASISKNGTFGALAYSQVPAPALVQSASLFGMWSVTFLLCLVASAIGLALVDGRKARAALAITASLFVTNLAFGYARLAAAPLPAVRVGAVTDDAIAFAADRGSMLTAARHYADLAGQVAAHGATTVVLPEKIGILEPEWSNVTAVFEHVARKAHSRIVVGFEERGTQNENVALAFEPTGTVERYVKRHLIPHFEPLAPGSTGKLLSNGGALEICKDMDFQATIRGDARNGINIAFVPAWDFVTDRDAHANMAIMRGVENGFAVVRSAREGLITISDSQGRIVSRADSSSVGPVTLLADVAPGRGRTLYVRIGDVFAWGCLAMAVALCVAAARHSRRPDSDDRGLADLETKPKIIR